MSGVIPELIRQEGVSLRRPSGLPPISTASGAVVEAVDSGIIVIQTGSTLLPVNASHF